LGAIWSVPDLKLIESTPKKLKTLKDVFITRTYLKIILTGSWHKQAEEKQGNYQRDIPTEPQSV
jgi:hypothetical protein